MTTSPPAIPDHSINPLDNILTLEDQYYQEGYTLGLADGSHSGKLEGRATGLETGFEKFKQMGMLVGKTAVWAGRLARMDLATTATASATTRTATITAAPSAPLAAEAAVPLADDDDKKSKVPIAQKKISSQSQTSSSHRLRKHVATLHALSDAQTLSTVNDEDACTAFDDRLKRATAKARVVESIMGDEKALKEEEYEEYVDGSLERHGSDGKKRSEGKRIVDLREW